MASWTLIGIAASIAVIATSVAVVAGMLLQWPIATAAVAGLLVAAGLGLVQFLLSRGRDEPSDASRLDALEQSMGDLLDRIERVAQRQRGTDNALVERVRTATEPLVQEIAALSGRVAQLAEDGAAREPAQAGEPRRPVAPKPQPPMPAMPRAASLPAAPAVVPPAAAPISPARTVPPPPVRADAVGPPAPPMPTATPAPARPDLPRRPEPPAPARPEPQPPLRPDLPPPRSEPPLPALPAPTRTEPVRPPDLPRFDKPVPPTLPPRIFESPFQIPKRDDAPPPARPAAKRNAAPIPRQSSAPDPADVERAALLREALAGGRHDLHLQQIVRLPSRRLSHYEAILRLRDAKNAAIESPEVFAAAERSGVAPDLDRAAFEATAVLLRRLAAASKATGAVLSVAPASFAEGGIMTRLADLANADPILAEHLVLQMPQASWTALPPTEADKVAALVEIGFRFSIDRLTHMRLDGRELARRGVRFVKLPASLLLDPRAAATSPIHPNDLAGLLERNGVTLVVDHVEQEATVATLLEIGVKFAQGPVFGEPRPMRVEVPAEADEASPKPPAAAPAATKGVKPAKPGGARTAGMKPRS